MGLRRTNHSGSPLNFRIYPLLAQGISRLRSILLVLCVFGYSAWGQEKDFVVQGARVTLEDVTETVAVNYQAMRFNFSHDMWNVEVFLLNQGEDALSGPFLLLIDSFTGIAGLAEADGRDAAGKVFVDVSRQVPRGLLTPGQNSEGHTMSLAPGVGNPQLVTRVYARRQERNFALAVVRTLV